MTENNIEEKKAQGDEQKTTAQDPDAGIEAASKDILTRSIEAHQSLKIENDRLEKQIKELREIKSLEILGGTTQTGQRVKPQEETPKDYMKRIMSGR